MKYLRPFPGNREGGGGRAGERRQRQGKGTHARGVHTRVADGGRAHAVSGLEGGDVVVGGAGVAVEGDGGEVDTRLAGQDVPLVERRAVTRVGGDQCRGGQHGGDDGGERLHLEMCVCVFATNVVLQDSKQ